MIKVYSRNKIYWFKSKQDAAPIMRADPTAEIIEFKVYWHPLTKQWEVTT